MRANKLLIWAGGVVVIVTLAVAISSLLKPTKHTSLETVSLRLPIPIVDVAFSPYYIADDMGYFTDKELSVEVLPGSAELNPARTVAAGIDEFGVLGGPELLFRARSQGLPLVAIAQVHKDSDFVSLVTKADSGIETIEDLEGVEVGMFFGHISTDVLRILFARTGVDVKEVDVGFNYSRFIADDLKAQWAFRTTAGLSLPARGIDVNFISPSDYGINTQGHIIVTTEGMIKKNPELVQRFVDAVLMGLNTSVADPELSVDAALARDKELPTDVALQQQEYYAEKIRLNPTIGKMEFSDFEHTRDQMVVLGLPDDLGVKDAFTNVFVDHFYETKQ